MTRISWNSNWPGSDGHRLRDAARSCGLKIIVTLDGVEQSGVFYADPEQGKIGRKVTTADGRVVIDPSDVRRPLVEEASGTVGFLVRRA